MDALESKIYDLLNDSVKGLGYGIVRVQYHKAKRTVLQIMIENLDGRNISFEDCSNVSNIASPILDVEDIIKDHYNLEVSSPGIDRPLVKLEDFIKFKGNKARVSLRQSQNQVRRLVGVINDVVGDSILFKLTDGSEISIDYDNVESSNVIMSDNLFLSKVK